MAASSTLGIVLLASALALGSTACKSSGETASGNASAECPPALGRMKMKREPGGHIPGMARALIRDRMHLHGDDMNDLLWAVMFLDYDSMKAISDDIAKTPRFARPMTGDGSEINAAIPARFFELQDQLQKGATTLADVASRNDGQSVAVAFANLSQTCIQCHALYLDEPKEQGDASEGEGEGAAPEDSGEGD